MYNCISSQSLTDSLICCFNFSILAKGRHNYYVQRSMLKCQKSPGNIKHSNRGILAVREAVALNSKKALQWCQDAQKTP